MNKKTAYQREWKRKKREDPDFRLQAAANQRKYYAKDITYRLKHREYRLKSRYGISLAQYQELFDRQEGRCALCKRHQDDLKHKLVLDHDHKSLEIRALLCNYCNLFQIGKLRKDTIQPIWDYLNSPYTGWFVPKKKRKKRCRRKKH